MPTYIYEVLDQEGNGTGEHFECVQMMRDKPLTKHPEDSRPVRRVPAMPTILGKWTDTKSKSTLSDKNLDRLGLTKYERKGNGYFEKSAGKGPNTLHSD